ncbi:MAG: efflux RND transporter periplasmic adaptor subunit [Burkholderiales bacterium]|nr:efflux RND transporter periplasmic adaptor subunit [Burkholderiales bacterium]
MKRWQRWTIPVVVVAVLGGFVARALIAKKNEQAAQTAPAKPAGGLDLAPGDLVVARSVDLPRTLEISGGLKAVNSAVIRARVAAEVKSLTVREGDKVQAGQVLGQLDTTELELKLKQAEQTASSTKSQLDIATRALENNRALVAQGFISATGLETSISNEAGARASYDAALSAVALARKSRNDATLVAPISGLVAQRMAQAGERVAIDTKLVEIVDLAQIEVEAALAPDDVAALTIGRSATLQVDGIAAPVTARVARINPSAQAGTRAIMVYLAVEPQPALRQGLFARGTIELDRKRALALPLSTVRTDQARPYVMLVKDGRAAATPVLLGARGTIGGEPWVEITSGLGEGAQVLGASTGVVRDGTPVRLSAQPAAVPASAIVPAGAVAVGASAPR